MQEETAVALHYLTWPAVGEIIRTVGVVVTAVVAIWALRNWSRQDGAKREAEFLDLIVDATHELLAQLPGPLTLLDMIHIGFMSRANDPEDPAELMRGATIYIQQHGLEQHKLLLERLEPVRPLRAKLKALTAKGQMFQFPNYQNQCIAAIESITRQVDRLEHFGVVVSSANWNWDHPEVHRAVQVALETTPSDTRPKLNAGNVQILDFARDAYGRLYGRRWTT
ncbi:hypothetical protein FB548_3566 [Pseudoxanthomonas sp. 3HH-4]|uniref:hypothetical protein n=1 Tax=Pseudoxanthomonas sp. 3HH-4 TaxID=1690214 RepID=UPI001151AE5E|nr:hypothetical protein [Pseudoxanthomonas sp. 3HH-4]TQM03607.1 hypothetical protein FB548_3566 [Pseudoxanthomonas sp. 3HH-4]